MGRTSIVLVVVALGLLGFIWFVERGSLSTTERELRKGRVVENFVRDKVTRVELQRHGVTTVLVRVAPNPGDPLDLGGWQVEAPYRAKADSGEVDSLLGAMEWAEARRSLGAASDGDSKQFGLDAPRYRVRFSAGREEGGFSVGARAADGGGAYLKRRDSDAVYVVGADLLDALEHVPEDFHAKDLHDGLTVLTTQVLELRSQQQAKKLVRKAGFFWLDATLASTPEIKAVVDTLDALRATRYIGEKATPELALQQPRFAIDVDSLVYDPAHKGEQHTERFSLQVGASCANHQDESYIQVGQGAVYCASNVELAKLERTPAQLREMRVLPLDADGIRGAVLRDHERELSLTTVENATRYRLTLAGKEQKSGVADPEALKHWYDTLRELRFASFQAHSGPALADSAVQVSFKRSGKDEDPYLLQLDASKQKATRLAEPALLELPPQAAQLLAPMAARYRAKRVLDEDESQLTALAISGTDRAQARVEKRGAEYELVVPVRAPAASRALDELARLFSKLDALSFEADAVLPEHGLTPPYRALTVEYSGGADAKAKARSHTLLIGAQASEQGRYARLDADPSVFIISNALAGKLDQSLGATAAP
jgi:DTW domain-containing protein YfiP